MKLSLSIAPRSLMEARAIFRTNDARGRLVEVRVDAVRDLDLPTLLRPPRPAVIITNRRRGEGGMFRGDAREQVALREDQPEGVVARRHAEALPVVDGR